MNCEHNFKMYWIIKETLHFATDEGEESIIYASVIKMYWIIKAFILILENYSSKNRN